MKEYVIRGTLQFPFQHYEINQVDNHEIITAHWHDEVEIILVIQGELLLINAQSQYLLQSGDLFFVNSGEMHQMFRNSEDLHYYAYVFPLDFLAFAKDDYTQSILIQPLLQKQLLFTNHIDKSHPAYPHLHQLTLDLVQLDQERLATYQLDTKSLLYLMLSQLHRHHLFIPTQHVDQFQLEKFIIAYLNEHYSEQISLAQICQKVNLTPTYFCRYFKSQFKKSFIEYLNYIRIEKACVLLKSTTLSILTIALEVGYHNVSYFNRQFKSIMLISPKNYRKQAQLE